MINLISGLRRCSSSSAAAADDALAVAESLDRFVPLESRPAPLSLGLFRADRDEPPAPDEWLVLPFFASRAGSLPFDFAASTRAF